MNGPVGSTSPPVTVGLPVYNGETFLRGAITSLLAQQYGDFELIVSDNASTDGTEAICREFAREDARVVYHRADRNRGAAWNFTRLPHLARGKYFRWHAHDDECLPPFLGVCVEVLDHRPEVSLVYSQTVDYDGDGNYLETEPLTGTAGQANPVARVRSLLLRPAFPAAAPFGLVRREQFLRTDLLPAYKGSDRTLLVQLALLGRFHEIDQPWFIHRRHPGRSAALPRAEWMTWWDGGPAGRRIFPRSRLLRGYASGIARSPVPVATRTGALAHLPLWAARNASPLAREALSAVGSALASGGRRPVTG